MKYFRDKTIPLTMQDVERFDKEVHGPATTSLEFIRMHLAQETSKMHSYEAGLDTAEKNIEYLKKTLADARALVKELTELVTMLEKQT